MKKRPGAALHSSWNWELISDKTLDWWVPRLGRIKKAYPNHVLVASIMAGSGNDTELRHWQELAIACQEQGCDALELNLSCPHMDRPDMGSNVGKDKELVSIVTKAVKEVAKIPVWAKLTPSTTDIVVEARGAFLGGADAIVSSNTFTSLPLIDAETLDFEVHVDGFVSTGGLGGPAILPLSLAKMSQLTQAFPNRSFSGIGGISTFEHALNYFLLGCGTVQVCTAAMLDHAIGPNVIKELEPGADAVPRDSTPTAAGSGWTTSSASGATAWCRSRRSAGRTRRTTAAATTPRATRSRSRTSGLRGSGGCPSSGPCRIFTNDLLAQLVEREAALLDRLLFGDRAAVHRAQEVVQQSLPGRGVVEHVADERRLRGLLDEVAEPIRRRVEPFEEERVHRGVARRQLRGMQIPALIEAGDERVADVLVVQTPRAVHDLARPIGITLVAPSDSQMPVPASATCITCLAKSHTGWSMC